MRKAPGRVGPVPARPERPARTPRAARSPQQSWHAAVNGYAQASPQRGNRRPVDSPTRKPQGVRTARNPRRAQRNLLPYVAAVLVILAISFLGFQGVRALGSLLFGGADNGSVQGSSDLATIQDQQSGPGDIVIGLNGDADTYVLKGEEYLEAGAHAAEPTDGLLNSKIKTTGKVNTNKPGDYKVTYHVQDSTGHTATATRTVHVVDSMDTMDGGMPILMYHYIYSADAPPETIDGNHLLDTKFEEQLQYLTENNFYFPSYPEIRAFLQGKHSLPAKSIALTFDDGEAGFLNVGIPLLEKYKVPATSFIICSDADAAQKVIDHRSAYVSFQSHSYGLHQAGGTVGHGGLISALTKDQIVEDLKKAQDIVGATEAFAYPFGDVTEDGKAAVDEAGILCAFTTKNAWAHVGDDVRALPRVRISGEYELEGYKSLVQ